MDNKTLWVVGGLGALVVLWLARRSSGAGAQVVPGPDTSAETQARFGFASEGITALTKLADDMANYAAQRDIEAQRDAAITNAAAAQADAQKVAARESSRGKRGVHVTLPFGLGTYGFNF